MYTLLPPIEPRRQIETSSRPLLLTGLPFTKQEIVQDYLLKTSSTKENYYVDINPKPAHIVGNPIIQKLPEKGSSAKPQIKERFKTTVTQTLPKYVDNDCPAPNTKKNATVPKTKTPSPKTGKRLPEVGKTEIRETKAIPGCPRLKDISFTKHDFGKQMIARYNPKNDSDSNCEEDNLIIVWNEHNKAQLLTYKGKNPTRYVMGHCFPQEKSSFRVHNFKRAECTKKSPKRVKKKAAG